ncbi:MAG: protein kinase domain-containing protein, partial [Bacteroidota bacterium]
MGEVCGNFEILDILGKGGMGVVYRAKDLRLDRIVALKELILEQTLSEVEKQDTTERFRREAMASARLKHNNIVTVYDYGQFGGRHFMAMELLEGKSLGDHIEAKTQFTFQQVVDIGIQICAGLDYAHANGVVHRDIKPDNIMVLNNGAVKITDFGVARVRSDLPSMTQTGTTLGTIAYISPEQLCDSRLVDGRSDLFSLGGLLYELLTFKTPFDAGSLGGTILKIMNEQPIPLRQYNPAIPVRLEQVILRSLRKNPDERFPRAAEMAQALAASMKEPPPQAQPQVPSQGSQVSPAPMAHSPMAQPPVGQPMGMGMNRPIPPGGERRIPQQIAEIQFVQAFGKAGFGQGEFQQPRGLYIDPNRNVLVSDTENGRIQVFNPQGRFLKQIRPVPSQESFRFPRALASNTLDILYIVDDLDFRIYKYDSHGRQLAIWKRARTGDENPAIPGRIVISPSGQIYLSEPNNHRVLLFDANEKFVMAIGRQGELQSPMGLALDPRGFLCVLDYGLASVVVYDKRGMKVANFGKRGNGPGEFAVPRDLAVDRFGFLYVADTLNHRIQ